MSISQLAAKLIGDKRGWREYRARVEELPENYRAALEAFERYLMYFGGADADGAAAMFEDLAELFEQSAADGTPIRAIGGADPVEFIDGFIRNYPQGQWIARERQKLTDTLNSVAGGDR